jgi:general secretion pathway protein H
MFAMAGTGVAASARLKRSAVMIAGAVRIASAHSTAIGKPVRLVFDFDQRSIGMEEASDAKFSVRRNDASAGAAPATEAETKAIEEADAILAGPRAPRPTFTATKAVGFSIDKEKQGKSLEQEIRFLAIETEHEDKAVGLSRAYLYFWPGGAGERAAIQLSIGGSELDADTMTVVISPLTGKAELKKGRWNMLRPRDDTEASERQDPGP